MLAWKMVTAIGLVAGGLWAAVGRPVKVYYVEQDGRQTATSIVVQSPPLTFPPADQMPEHQGGGVP